MKLATRIAAKNIATRFARNRRCAQPVWGSLGLRWRRVRRPVPMQALRAASPFVAQSWLSQFHLHFALVGTHERRQSASPAIHSSVVVWRPMREKLIVRAPLAARAPQHADSVLPPSQLVHQVAIRREHVSREVQFRHTASQVHHRRIERTTISNLIFRKASQIRAASRRPIPESEATRSLVHRQSTPPPLAMLRSRRQAQPQRSPEPASRPAVIIPVRTPALVWHKPEKVNAENAHEHTGENASRASAQSSRPSFSNPPQQIAWQTQSATAMRPAALDSATVDRLAEDVIRRVERHIRIERERRGM
jgi:hypothetical protein